MEMEKIKESYLVNFEIKEIEGMYFIGEMKKYIRKIIINKVNILSNKKITLEGISVTYGEFEIFQESKCSLELINEIKKSIRFINQDWLSI